MRYQREKHVALEAVTAAARLSAMARAQMVGAQYVEKRDRSPVTVADFAAQALICRHLGEHFPGDAIVGEERADLLRRPEFAPTLEQVAGLVRQALPAASPELICEWIDQGSGKPGERFWTLDPIDGTKGFLRNGQYAIALALIEDGAVVLGALACPALSGRLDEPTGEDGVVFVALRGGGAEMLPLRGGPPARIHVAPRGAAGRLVESVEAAHGNQSLQEVVARAVGIDRPALRVDSQAKYGLVARGDATLYLRLPSAQHPDYREAIWDHAAGAIIVAEAGGTVSDSRGAPLDFTAGARLQHNRGVVASGGLDHAAVIAALGEANL